MYHFAFEVLVNNLVSTLFRSCYGVWPPFNSQPWNSSLSPSTFFSICLIKSVHKPWRIGFDKSNSYLKAALNQTVSTLKSASKESYPENTGFDTPAWCWRCTGSIIDFEVRQHDWKFPCHSLRRMIKKYLNTWTFFFSFLYRAIVLDVKIIKPTICTNVLF